jgi:hypothetical protein
MADITFEHVKPLIEQMPSEEIERLRAWLNNDATEVPKSENDGLTWGERLVAMVNQFELTDEDQMDIDDPEAWVREYRRSGAKRG